MWNRRVGGKPATLVRRTYPFIKPPCVTGVATLVLSAENDPRMVADHTGPVPEIPSTRAARCLSMLLLIELRALH